MSDKDQSIMVSDLSYDREEIDAVTSVLRSEWLTMGPKTGEFEKALASYLGANHVIAVNNGTAALHLGLLSLGVGRGDEVIVTPMSFVASANAILYVGARPVFVDIDPETFNIDPDLVKEKITKKTKVILPVHMAGLPAEIDPILDVAEEQGIDVLDDAAHAIGSEYRNKRIGGFKSITAFSFFSNKNLSVGEGGAITTHSAEIAERLRLLRSHGLTKSTWSRHHNKDEESSDQLYNMIELGHNYRITEMSAALGIVQLGKLNRFNARRKEAYNLYRDLLEGLEIEFQAIPAYVKHSHHILPVLLPRGVRGKTRFSLKQRGIETSIHYTPIHRFRYYQEHGYSDVSLPNAEEMGDRVITLPLHQKLSDDQVCYVVSELRNALVSQS